MLRGFIEYCKELLCEHDWEVEENLVYGSHQEYRDVYGYTQLLDITNDLPKGKKWTYRCKKCGTVKIKKNY